jgi:hypothetical protein
MTAAKPWTPHEWMRARTMRNNGDSYAKIDHSLGRRLGSTQGKFDYVPSEKQSIKDGDQLPGLNAPSEVLADRDARREAADRRDLTATLCGDPAPGWSMRDRERSSLVGSK